LVVRSSRSSPELLLSLPHSFLSFLPGRSIYHLLNCISRNDFLRFFFHLARKIPVSSAFLLIGSVPIPRSFFVTETSPSVVNRLRRSKAIHPASFSGGCLKSRATKCRLNCCDRAPPRWLRSVLKDDNLPLPPSPPLDFPSKTTTALKLILSAFSASPPASHVRHAPAT